MTLLSRIKELCKDNSITLAKLEKSLNFGNGTLSRWDTSSPSVDKIQKVADYFGVSVDYLLGNKKSPLKSELEGVYLNFAKEAEENGIHPDDIKLAIETIKRLRSN